MYMHVLREITIDPANVPPPSLRRYAPLFIALQALGGQLGLPIFIFTICFARGVKRHLTLVNFCATWVVYSVVYCLTIYNKRNNHSGSGGRLCVAQAAMVHGVVPMCATAYTFVICQVWYGLQMTKNTAVAWFERHQRLTMALVLSSPYIVFVSFTLGSLVIALRYSSLVSRDGHYYCTIHYNPLVYAVPGYAAALIAIMFFMKVIIIVQISRRWTTLWQLGLINRPLLSFAIRMLIFSVYGVVTLASASAFLSRTLTMWPYLIQASLPLAVFLFFGTQKDVFRAWLSCCRRTKWKAEASGSTAQFVEVERTRIVGSEMP